MAQPSGFITIFDPGVPRYEPEIRSGQATDGQAEPMLNELLDERDKGRVEGPLEAPTIGSYASGGQKRESLHQLQRHRRP